MATAFLSEVTLDDLMRSVIEEILNNGNEIKPTKGSAIEVTGVLLELTNPRARLSRTETRGKPFSCLGELCWYLAKTNDLGFISYNLTYARRRCAA
jgi:thymidylate synthase